MRPETTLCTDLHVLLHVLEQVPVTLKQCLGVDLRKRAKQELWAQRERATTVRLPSNRPDRSSSTTKNKSTGQSKGHRHKQYVCVCVCVHVCMRVCAQVPPANTMGIKTTGKISL
jgi:hypothetical protein